MTLEEKADKYAFGLKLTDSPLGYFYEYMQKAYIAGATENGVVWHDLRKDPEDLPTDKHFKITSDGDIALYDWFLEKWYDLRSCELTYHPAAWCEIPRFEED